ncbi:N-alpha-acetyltransferase 20 [Scaptodrosophila lebanonensis]|uniref:N-alpha-acetyltransferase 20 n=1 Tax=Drosophila lebanonensis TaxID=7225 RepID=A0A6J2TQS7_DROLE|nr:N-alpha-acetyltransferase 20 [Scaptodrosophila lebanonensis]
MVSLREFFLDDLLKFNCIVMDPYTEVYSLSFFFNILLKFPQLSHTAVSPGGQLIGFILGKIDSNESVESNIENGHICALSVSDNYRRLGLATRLMESFTDTVESHGAWYMDLYARERNKAAIKLYESLGFVKYRWLPNFYRDDNGYDMRKPLKCDVGKQSLKGSWFDRFVLWWVDNMN